MRRGPCARGSGRNRRQGLGARCHGRERCGDGRRRMAHHRRSASRWHGLSSGAATLRWSSRWAPLERHSALLRGQHSALLRAQRSARLEPHSGPLERRHSAPDCCRAVRAAAAAHQRPQGVALPELLRLSAAVARPARRRARVSAERVRQRPVQLVSAERVRRQPVQLVSAERVRRRPVQLASAERVRRRPVQLASVERARQRPAQRVSVEQARQRVRPEVLAQQALQREARVASAQQAAALPPGDGTLRWCGGGRLMRRGRYRVRGRRRSRGRRGFWWRRCGVRRRCCGLGRCRMSGRRFRLSVRTDFGLCLRHNQRCGLGVRRRACELHRRKSRRSEQHETKFCHDGLSSPENY